MRCGKSLEKRCMPGVGRKKIQPGRPRIREVLDSEVKIAFIIAQKEIM